MHTGVLRRICEASDIDSLAKIMKQGDRQEKRKRKRICVQNTHSSSHSRGHQFSKDDKTDGRQGMTYVQLYTVLIDSGVVGMPQCTAIRK